MNIKFSGKNDGTLNMVTLDKPDQPDFYLVLTGRKQQAGSSHGKARPFTIASIFLFDRKELVNQLRGRVKIREATSVRRHLWDAAEVYPRPNNPLLRLTQSQRSEIELFNDDSAPAPG